MDNYLEIPAIKVTQPFGSFFIAKIKAFNLLEISFPNKLRIINDQGKLLGNQRDQQAKRIEEIARYINTVECAFPNSIIIATNWSEDGYVVEDESVRWTLQKKEGGGDIYDVIIPTNKRIASIIDGQHRLYGFESVDKEHQNIELVCAIYFDLPNPLQAYVFATINFNQKKVDKSLAYELYGYNLDTEEAKAWSPEKLAVYITRKLNLEKDSPFYNHIIIAPQDDNLIFEISPKKMDWQVSTATIVEGVMSLFSQNHIKDRDIMYQFSVERGRSRSMLSDDGTPLRKYYIETNDLLIYKAVENFFTAAKEVLFEGTLGTSYIKKTVGIQALFAVLKTTLNLFFENDKNISLEYFVAFLSESSLVNFSDDFFQASGVGKSRIRNTILFSNGLVSENDIKPEDLQTIKNLLQQGN